MSMVGQPPDHEQFNLLISLGTIELRQGNTVSAIDNYLKANSMLERLGDKLSPDDKVKAKFQLAVAWLRKGETDNCVCNNSSDSCILPIQGNGIHEHRDGSVNAIKYLTLVLKEKPEHATARWLLNLAYMTLGEYPNGVPEEFLIPLEKFKSQQNFPHFIDVAPQLGLNTFNLCGGVILDDFDNDYDLDIITSSWDTSESLRFFQNNGDGTFTDRSKEAGFEGLYGGLNMIQADYDNDGDLDIFVPRGAWLMQHGRHPNSLLKNDGTGTFIDVTLDAGLAEVHYPSQTAAWADYDNDGDLDLYIGNESLPAMPAPCQLFENDGKGGFQDVTKIANVENLSFTKAVTWGDYNGDQYPDIYVSNFFNGKNRLFRNNRDGTFSDVAHSVGVTEPENSFPAWFWDFNNDGNLDLFVSSYAIHGNHAAIAYIGQPQSLTPRLYQGDGSGRFSEVSGEQNLTQNVQAMGANYGDLDNDGFPDFYLGTGVPDFEGLMPNIMYRNLGGTSFTDVTFAGGFGHLQKGHAIAFGDLDHDGDQDIYAQMGGVYRGDKFGNLLFENPGFGNRWIIVKLKGTTSNRSAIGARIHACITEGIERRSIYKWVNSGGSFGANPLRQHIGLGKADQIGSLEIFWPTTGKTQRYKDIPLNCMIEITEGARDFERIALKKSCFKKGNGL
jgi:hypothetical protein